MAPRKKSSTAIVVTDAATTPAKTTSRGPSVDIYMEYHGKQFSVKDITKAVKDIACNSKKCKVYVKPEDGKVYIVADGEQFSIEL
ncbi:MAG: hypothetical protein IKC38_06585 [Clostridia bacterium]|nr:hypothetical protein [Clostridia bacterium]